MASGSNDPFGGNWNIERLIREVLSSREVCIAWCQNVGLLPAKRKCPKDGKHLMKLCNTSRSYQSSITCIGKRWRCRKHGVERTVAEKTWFEFHNLTMEDILRITYYFAKGFKYENVRDEIKNIGRSEVSSESIVDMYSYCREVCILTIDRVASKEGPIGGPGKIVEIDEMKFGRRKYERGRVVEGSWIFGAIDITTGALRLEICPQNQRDRGTLIPIIKKHIKAGSKIYSDCWKAYDCLGQEGYEHLSVNHSIEFVNAETGANTQTIESQWRPLRLRLQRGGVRSENLDYHLASICGGVRQKEIIWTCSLN